MRQKVAGFAALILSLESVAAESTQPISPAPDAGGFLQMLLTISLVLGAMFLAAHYLKRHARHPHKQGSSLRIVDVARIGAREKIIIAEVAGQWLVLGVTPHNITSLATLPQPAAASNDDVSQPVTPLKKEFASWLHNALQKNS